MKKWINAAKPETVVKWHRLKFTKLWARKSKRIGGASIDREIVNLVRKIYSENFNITPEKIYEQLILLASKNLPAPNSIAKYIKDIMGSPAREQIEHSSKRIVHFTIIKNSNMFWIARQFRNATTYRNRQNI